MRGAIVGGLMVVLLSGCGGAAPPSTEDRGSGSPTVGPARPDQEKKTGQPSQPVVDAGVMIEGRSLRDWANDLQGEDANKRQHAAILLAAKIRPEARSIVPVLRQVLKDSDPATRAAAARALAQVAPEYPETVKVLIEDGLCSGDRIFRDIHVEPLRRHGKLAVAPLCAALKDSNPEVKEMVAEVLGRIGPEAKEAVPGLLELAKEKSASPARAAAIRALGQIKADAKAVVPVLFDQARADLREGIHAGVFDALRNFGGEAAGARRFLEEGLKTSDQRFLHAVALLRLDPEAREARLLLIEYLETAQYRTEAVQELVRNGKSAVPDLRDALRHRHPAVRAAAGEALKAIDPEAARAAGIE